MWHNRRLTAAAGLTMALITSARMVGAQHYTVVDLGTLAGPNATSGPGSHAYGLNNNGIACGVSIDDTDQSDLHAVRWDGSLVDLGVFGADVHSMAFDINAVGNMAGVTFTFGETVPQAVRWNGLSAAGLGAWSARGINDSGVIVGEKAATASGAYSHAVRWTNGSLTDLGTLGGTHSSAYSVDNSGRVVGVSYLTGDSSYRAFLWKNGVMSDLGTLGGADSHAYDISDSGFVVGVATKTNGKQHGFRYTLLSDGTVQLRTDLGHLGGGHSVAYAVNEAGDVVGSSNWRAFIWRNGVMTDLNSLIDSDTGWELTHALAVNDAGLIAGRGKHYGNDRAFVLRPISPGDANADGVVNIDDLLMVVNFWGPCPSPPADCDADVFPAPGGNGVVNIDDLLQVINNWPAPG